MLIWLNRGNRKVKIEMLPGEGGADAESARNMSNKKKAAIERSAGRRSTPRQRWRKRRPGSGRSCSKHVGHSRIAVWSSDGKSMENQWKSMIFAGKSIVLMAWCTVGVAVNHSKVNYIDFPRLVMLFYDHMIVSMMLFWCQKNILTWVLWQSDLLRKHIRIPYFLLFFNTNP